MDSRTWNQNSLTFFLVVEEIFRTKKIMYIMKHDNVESYFLFIHLTLHVSPFSRCFIIYGYATHFLYFFLFLIMCEYNTSPFGYSLLRLSV